MYKGNKIIAVIPARGGSKGVPGKNIKDLAGKPLIAWTIEEAQKSEYIDKLIVSSDSEKIIKIANEFGCEAPFIRPKELSGDNVPGVEPFIHAVNSMDGDFEYAILLQCTSPLRTANDIDGIIRLCIDSGVSSSISVCISETLPSRMLLLDDKGRLAPFIDNEDPFLPRQKLNKVYEFNGAAYIIRTDVLMRTKKLQQNDTLGYVMGKENSVDIDEINDFAIAEALIGNIQKK